MSDARDGVDPANACPGCGMKLNAATASTFDESHRPEPGCFTVCAYCGITSVFIEGGKLRAATRKDVDALDPETAYELGRVTGAILRRLREN